MGPGVGALWTSACAVCGRLYPFHPWSSGRRPGDGMRNALARRQAHTYGKLRKSVAARPWEREFWGFSFTGHRQPKRRIAPQALVRFKGRIRARTSRTRGASIVPMAAELSRYLRGRPGYWGRCQTPSVLRGLGVARSYGVDQTSDGEWGPSLPRKR